MTRNVSLYDAKTQLSALVEAAANGEEIVICKNGVPKARLAPLPRLSRKRKPAGALKVTYISDDFDEVDPEIVKMFEGA